MMDRSIFSLVILLTLCGVALYRVKWTKTSTWQTWLQDIRPDNKTKELSKVALTSSGTVDVETGNYMKLYFELHNLENHRKEVLPKAKDTLLSFLSEAFCRERINPASILSMKEFCKKDVVNFLRKQESRVAEQWEEYTARRREGGPRELFQTRDEARTWLKRIAPLKLVDGAWLGHIHRVSTTPFALRHVTRDAWQVMSEEFGDGKLEQHHVHLYRQLLQSADCRLPEAHSSDFINPRHWGLDGQDQQEGTAKLRTRLAWKAAVAQLLISLFPEEFLPEVLGYNMHFELVTLETMQAARELEEADIKLSGYYFFIHVSIDNSHSGHTAMAMQTVFKYLEHIEVTQGVDAAKRAWRRVQAGYCLSAAIASPSPPPPAAAAAAADNDNKTNGGAASSSSSSSNYNPRERNEQLIDMLQLKAHAGGKFHCASRVRIGGQTLAKWLEADSFISPQHRRQFLASLADMTPWIRRGDSANSRLIRELSWGGKMFGSFTKAEVALLRRWIDGLGNHMFSPAAYMEFVAGQEEGEKDSASSATEAVASPSTGANSSHDHHHHRQHYDPWASLDDDGSAGLNNTVFKEAAWAVSSSSADNHHHYREGRLDKQTVLARLLPLWFTYPTLLEGFVSVPSRTANETNCAVVRLLRAYNGFGTMDEHSVGGTDESRRKGRVVDLVELGLRMAQATMDERGGGGGGDGMRSTTTTTLVAPSPLQDLRDVLDTWPCRLSVHLLQLSRRPAANWALLLGVAAALSTLHEAVLASPKLLPPQDRRVLQTIVWVERRELEACSASLSKGDLEQYRAGWEIGSVGTADLCRSIVRL